MAGPTTSTEIMSLASILLGKGAFTTIDPSNKFAVAMQELYNLIVPAELESGKWNFARTWEQLGNVAGFEPDIHPWQYGFYLPSNYLSLSRLDPNIDFEIFGQRIYTMTKQELHIEYFRDVPVSEWTASFRQYIVTQLASYAAAGVTENERVMSRVDNKVFETRATSRFANAQSRPNRAMRHKPWIQVRR